MKQLPVQAQAPDFRLDSLSGDSFHLAEEIVAAPLVLAFFKVSCPTCQFTFPYLQKIHAGSLSSAVRIFGISQDSAEATKEFAREYGIGFQFLIDEHPYEVSSQYGLEYVPGIFVVDSSGRIQLSDFGFSKAALVDVGRLVAESIHQPPAVLFTPDDGIPATRPG
jgi:peroxiredoxin